MPDPQQKPKNGPQRAMSYEERLLMQRLVTINRHLTKGPPVQMNSNEDFQAWESSLATEAQTVFDELKANIPSNEIHRWVDQATRSGFYGQVDNSPEPVNLLPNYIFDPEYITENNNTQPLHQQNDAGPKLDVPFMGLGEMLRRDENGMTGKQGMGLPKWLSGMLGG